jgi:hypothetical protein
MLLEVDGVEEECIALAVVADEGDEGGGAAEVLAFGGLGLVTIAGVRIDRAWVVPVVLARMNSAVTSPPGTVIQLNLNLGTVSGSPVKCQ